LINAGIDVGLPFNGSAPDVGWFESGIAPLAGDYNSNHFVDAADYVVWRKSDATSGGYVLWRSNFGNANGSSDSLTAAVPEPGDSVVLIVSAVSAWLLCRRTGASAKLCCRI